MTIGTFHVFIADLLRSGSTITIHCMCLRTAMWTQDHLSLFSPAIRLWTATEAFRCEKCGRLGQVRDVDIHATHTPDVCKAEKIRKAIPLKDKPAFGKRRPSCDEA